MTKEEKIYYMNKKSVGYWSACGGIEVKDINAYSEYVVIMANAWNGQRSIHKLKIHTGENPYIKFAGHRYKFSDCIAM